jgi:hypothetical protein
MQKNSVKICHDGISLISFMPSCMSILSTNDTIRLLTLSIEFDSFLGSFFVFYAANGSNRCGSVSSVLDGHAYLSFSLHLSLVILWYVYTIHLETIHTR